MDTTFLSIAVAVLSILASTVVGVMAYNLSRQSQRASNQRAIGDLYAKMMDFRAVHPEVMKLSNKWNVNCFAALYRQATETERQWAIYYTYMELCLDFCNTVLYGHKTGALDRLAYEGHYEPLLRLILTENYPFISSSLSGSYMSELMREYLHSVETAGWNWIEKRKSLVGIS